MAFGLMGACRSHEFPEIRLAHIKRYSDMYFVTLPKEFTKTKARKNEFAITGQLFHFVQKYEKLRPSHVKTDRFFLNFQKGKCTVQPIGKQKFYKMPFRIAEYLELEDPHLYTCNFEEHMTCFVNRLLIQQKYPGHSFRRTSATFLANTGASIEDIKRQTGHKSTNIAYKYIGESKGHKIKTGNAIAASLSSSSLLETIQCVYYLRWTDMIRISLATSTKRMQQLLRQAF